MAAELRIKDLSLIAVEMLKSNDPFILKGKRVEFLNKSRSRIESLVKVDLVF